MTDDRSPIDRLLDLAVFAPVGLAVTAGQEFPKLVEKGRHRVEGQVHKARLVGQFAVQLGRRQVAQWASRPDADPAGQTVGSPGSGAGRRSQNDAAALAPALRRDPTRDDLAVDQTVPVASANGTDIASGDGAGDATGANGRDSSMRLAIPGYDSLSASQVVQRLDGLSSTELADVRAHELASRRRRTILNRVDQLLTGPPPGSG